ncbi:ribonuclease HII [Thermosulfuriphilus sp.]
MGSASLADRLQLEQEIRTAGYRLVAGVDEAGRGALAGPVVAAAVILPEALFKEESHLKLINDSKALSPEARKRAYRMLISRALCWAVAEIGPEDIDQYGILKASLLAMKVAVESLDPRPDFLLIDGPFCIDWPGPQRAIKHGDARCLSIGAASIIAKVHRDQLMARLHQDYPQYNFARNKGYGTKEHRLALAHHGPCPLHRRSFRGVLSQEEKDHPLFGVSV